MSRISIEVTPTEHRQIKVLASLQQKTIKELMLDNLLHNSKKQSLRSFNVKTKKAIHDVKSKKNLTSYKSLGELFNKLGI